MSKSRRRPGARPRPEQRRHKPVWTRKLCQSCRRPVIVAEEDVGNGRLRGALLHARPMPRGMLVLRKDGYVVRDPEFTQPGVRYAWHSCPVRNPEREAFVREQPGTAS